MAFCCYVKSSHHQLASWPLVQFGENTENSIFASDTPGLHLHHRIIHMLTPEEARDLHPRGRLKPYVAPPLAQESSLDARK